MKKQPVLRLAVFVCRNVYKIVEIKRKIDYNNTDKVGHTMLVHVGGGRNL